MVKASAEGLWGPQDMASQMEGSHCLKKKERAREEGGDLERE
jgi:hypothetical protein